jgi:hypothetical protein
MMGGERDELRAPAFASHRQVDETSTAPISQALSIPFKNQKSKIVTHQFLRFPLPSAS